MPSIHLKIQHTKHFVWDKWLLQMFNNWKVARFSELISSEEPDLMTGDGQFALKNWTLTTWKSRPLQFEKSNNPGNCPENYLLNISCRRTFDALTAVGHPLCINHIFCHFFLVWLSSPLANKGQQIFWELFRFVEAPEATDCYVGTFVLDAWTFNRFLTLQNL